jgi:hypothetical protein
LVLDYYRLKERVEGSGSSSTITEHPSFVGNRPVNPSGIDVD